MKFTLDWLRDHIETDLSVDEISEKLTSLGIEVEEIIDNNKKFENFVVGLVIKREKHPNADKLSLCQVDAGNNKILNIVCGAKNVRENMKVALALENAIIPSFGTALKKGKIRGIESEGMLCSGEELCLSMDHDGILDLSHIDDHPGTPLSKALKIDDVIFDVSLTPNRSDCFNVRGIARNLVSIGCGKLKPLKIEEFEESINEKIEIDRQTDDCPYFSCRIIKNVDNLGKTPDFISRRLNAIGQKLIFAPVDIANYICLDIGQPMHIFDLDKINHDKLIIKNATGNEILETLDQNKTCIPENTIIVCNSKETLSIAGIMGGQNSAFSENSKGIVIESAYFNKIQISLSGQILRINSDSRTRNERGIDPQNVDIAMQYATSLLKTIYPKCEISCINRSGNLPENRNLIVLHFEKFKNITGLSHEEWNESKTILKNLGMDIKDHNEEIIEVITPSYRHDLTIEEDIIEEILIVLGYDNIKENELDNKNPIISKYTDEILSELLINNGYNEIKTFSFIDETSAQLFSNPENLTYIKDPLNSEFSVLRPSIIASHLKALKNNQNKSQYNNRFFEIGKTFEKINDKIVERNTITFTISQKNHERNWRENQRDVSIFDIKSEIEKILDILCVKNYSISNKSQKYYHPGRSGSYTFRKNEILCYFGEIHPSISSNMNIDGPVISCEFFIDNFENIIHNKKMGVLNISQYQPVTRDFSFIVDNNITSKQIVDSILKLKNDIIKDINVFDIYQSKEIGDNKKAIAIEVLLQSQKNTLTDDEIKSISDMIIESVSKNCCAVLRAQS